MARKPIVRHFLACEEIERSEVGRHYTLHNLIHAFLLRPEAAFPRIEEEIALYAVLTDAVGAHSFTVELVTWDEEGQEEELFRSRVAVVQLGDDPLVVHGWPITLRNLRFPRAGLYEFRLKCEGELIAQESIRWRDES